MSTSSLRRAPLQDSHERLVVESQALMRQMMKHRVTVTLAKPSEQAASAESDKEDDSVHKLKQHAEKVMQAHKEAAQFASSYDEHGALWRVSTNSHGPNLLSMRHPQKLQPKSTFTRAPLLTLLMRADLQQPKAEAYANLALGQSPCALRALEAEG